MCAPTIRHDLPATAKDPVSACWEYEGQYVRQQGREMTPATLALNLLPVLKMVLIVLVCTAHAGCCSEDAGGKGSRIETPSLKPQTACTTIKETQDMIGR